MSEDAGRPFDGGPALPRRGPLLSDRYRLLEPIGRGGMSVVWRAYDEVLERPVAVKMLAQLDDRKLRLRLRAEARAASRLNHPRIAQVFDFGETDAVGDAVTPYIVMELVDGEPLSARLTRGVAVDPGSATTIGAQIAEALAAAHARGLVHRDIKPDNVIITESGVKLVDFGISAMIGTQDADDDGQILGTPTYVAPERIVDSPVGPAADLYSLGVLLYRLLTGVLPWPATTSAELLEAHLHLDAAPLPPIEGLPDDVAALCTACLAKDPALRPTGAEAAGTLGRAAQRIAAGPETPPDADVRPAVDLTRVIGGATAPTRYDARRRRRLVVLGVAGISLALLAAAWATGGRSPRPAAATTTAAPCDAMFTVVRDSGRDFAATVAITNTGPADLHGWQAAFVFPSGQTVSADPTSGTLAYVTPTDDPPYGVITSQSGADVTVRADPGQILRAGARATFPIRARYHGTNLLPTAFSLDGHPCRIRLAGALNPPAGPSTPAPTPVPAPTTATTPPGTRVGVSTGPPRIAPPPASTEPPTTAAPSPPGGAPTPSASTTGASTPPPPGPPGPPGKKTKPPKKPKPTPSPKPKP